MVPMTLKRLKKEVNKSLVGRTLPIVFLDTSAVIDICRYARSEQLRQKGRVDLPLHELYADHFLMDFGG